MEMFAAVIMLSIVFLPLIAFGSYLEHHDKERAEARKESRNRFTHSLHGNCLWEGHICCGAVEYENVSCAGCAHRAPRNKEDYIREYGS